MYYKFIVEMVSEKRELAFETFSILNIFISLNVIIYYYV
jgi:hypothetical protein